MRKRKNSLFAAGATGLAIGGAAALVIGCGTTRTVTVPGPAVTQTVPGPTVTQTVTASPPPPAAGSTLLTSAGMGTETTHSFTVGGSGDYIVSWTFANNDSQGDGGDNFIVNESTSGSGMDDSALSLPNVIQTSGTGSTEVDGDAGAHTFSVQADPTCNWTIRVVSAP
jgi:hypothetical protein